MTVETNPNIKRRAKDPIQAFSKIESAQTLLKSPEGRRPDRKPL
jgi:hypothetical protein